MLFSTAVAPAASFSCLLSFAVESTGPQFYQLALTCAGALAAVPALPGHVSTPSHPQPLPWPRHCPQPVSPCEESNRMQEACSAVLFEKVVRQAFCQGFQGGSVQKTLHFKPASLSSETDFQRPTVPETETFASKEQKLHPRPFPEGEVRLCSCFLSEVGACGLRVCWVVLWFALYLRPLLLVSPTPQFSQEHRPAHRGLAYPRFPFRGGSLRQVTLPACVPTSVGALKSENSSSVRPHILTLGLGNTVTVSRRPS